MQGQGPDQKHSGADCLQEVTLRNIAPEAGGMTPSAKCLLCMPENLSLIPQMPHNKKDGMHTFINPAPGVGPLTEGSLVLTGQPNR